MRYTSIGVNSSNEHVDSVKLLDQIFGNAACTDKHV
jgi:hypothetical protein